MYNIRCQIVVVADLHWFLVSGVLVDNLKLREQTLLIEGEYVQHDISKSIFAVIQPHHSSKIVALISTLLLHYQQQVNIEITVNVFYGRF